MSPLFIRTFLWLLLTVVLTFAAMTVATALDISPVERRRGPVSSIVALQLAEARHAWETGGREALQDTLQRFRQITDVDGVLTDANGRDLITGEDRSDLAAAVRERRRGPFWRRDRTVIGQRSPDGQYMYFTLLRRGSFVRWFLQPEIHLSVLFVLTILSYLFARRLTNPVRRLRDTVEAFGHGDLRVRLRWGRRDELGDLSRAFDQMADRIETLLAAERRLLLDISHELRSPLSRLGVAVELARSSPNEERHIDRIAREAERLNALVGELLQVTRAEGDAARISHQDLALDELLDGVIEDARLEAERRGCRVEWAQRSEVMVRADAELIRRATENVVRNAVRYAPAGTPVEISLWQNRTWVHVTVRDHGPGVPESDLPHIFDPFYRVESHRDRSSGGVGLGLAIARRAIEVHGGRIEAANAGPGLRVEIILPVQEPGSGAGG